MARYKKLYQRRNERSGDARYQQFKQHAQRERMRGHQF